MLAGFGYGDQGFKDLFRILSQSLCQFHAGMLAGCLFPAAVHRGLWLSPECGLRWFL